MSETGAPQVSAPRNNSLLGPTSSGTLFSKLYLLRSRDSSGGTAVPMGQEPLPRREAITRRFMEVAPPGLRLGTHSPPAYRLTRLSSRLATMEATCASPPALK